MITALAINTLVIKALLKHRLSTLLSNKKTIIINIESAQIIISSSTFITHSRKQDRKAVMQ